MEFLFKGPNGELTDAVRYELVRSIAEGGMGVVYQARQRGAGAFSKQVAIKVIREEYSLIREFRSNFVGEARLVADLVHPNVVQILHLGMNEQRYYMVMEYVDGITLADLIAQHRLNRERLPVDLCVFVAMNVARALEYAHERRTEEGRPLGIVHRDVNPKNILLSWNGEVKLTDFGIAKALDLMYNKEGEVIAGKYEYLSPEQARKEVTDGKADVFSLGVVLCESLLDENIFEGKSSEETLRRICNLEIPTFTKLRGEIDPKLNRLMRHALQREKIMRASALNMTVGLEELLDRPGHLYTHARLAAYLKKVFPKGRESLIDWESKHPQQGGGAAGVA
jgi:eukaryotic-like serine/threonine-protein kinase